MNGILNIKVNGEWVDIPAIKGDTGRGITSITKTGTSGLVDTYTITYSDSTTSTFTVTNGEDGGVLDVKVNGSSVVTSGIANITVQIIQYDTMPTATAALVGKPPIQYVGTTTTGGYSWETETYTSGLDTDKPATGYYKATDTSKWYKDGADITDLVGDVTELPTADANQLGKYKFNTTDTTLNLCIQTVGYTHGYFYEVVQSGGVYTWQQTNVQAAVAIDDTTITLNSNNQLQAVKLDGLVASISELNYCNGVTANIQTQLDAKQASLVSGTNIKTINNNSLLGSGNLDLDGLPPQTGQSGKLLTTDGTNASWGTTDEIIPLITSYVNGASGYRIWADGYCEQWGHHGGGVSGVITATFYKTYADTNYDAQVTIIDNESAGTFMAWTATKSTASMTIKEGYGYTPNYGIYAFDWKTSGYLAEGQY